MEFQQAPLTGSKNFTRGRPSRNGLSHLRILQARDGVLSGATHREIAVSLFGAEPVRRGWSTDGELRAQVRYLIRRGVELASVGYRSLVGIAWPKQGEDERPAEPP
jgi:hypothetical protein